MSLTLQGGMEYWENSGVSFLRDNSIYRLSGTKDGAGCPEDGATFKQRDGKSEVIIEPCGVKVASRFWGR